MSELDFTSSQGWCTECFPPHRGSCSGSVIAIDDRGALVGTAPLPPVESWASSPDVARAAEEASALTDEQLIARMTFLAAGATREGRIAAVVALMTAPKRPLNAEALAEAQRQRESAKPIT